MANNPAIDAANRELARLHKLGKVKLSRKEMDELMQGGFLPMPFRGGGPMPPGEDSGIPWGQGGFDNLPLNRVVGDIPDVGPPPAPLPPQQQAQPSQPQMPPQQTQDIPFEPIPTPGTFRVHRWRNPMTGDIATSDMQPYLTPGPDGRLVTRVRPPDYSGGIDPRATPPGADPSMYSSDPSYTAQRDAAARRLAGGYGPDGRPRPQGGQPSLSPAMAQLIDRTSRKAGGLSGDPFFSSPDFSLADRALRVYDPDRPGPGRYTPGGPTMSPETAEFGRRADTLRGIIGEGARPLTDEADAALAAREGGLRRSLGVPPRDTRTTVGGDFGRIRPGEEGYESPEWSGPLPEMSDVAYMRPGARAAAIREMGARREAPARPATPSPEDIARNARNATLDTRADAALARLGERRDERATATRAGNARVELEQRRQAAIRRLQQRKAAALAARERGEAPSLGEFGSYRSGEYVNPEEERARTAAAIAARRPRNPFAALFGGI